MVDVAIIKEWISKADEDFEFALVNLEEGRPFTAQICFHFQQSVEKYLKAYIISDDLEFRKTHDLPALLETCISKNSSFKQLSEDCEYLTIFYIETRYPVHWPTNYTKEEALKAKKAAEHIRDGIRNALRSLYPSIL